MKICFQESLEKVPVSVLKFTEFLIYRMQQMANQKRRNEQLIQRKNEDVTELERR